MAIRRIAVFASGSGTNAQNIIDYFTDNQHIEVSCLLSNKPTSYALTRAKNLGVEAICFTREQFYQTPWVVDYLKDIDIDLIVLAGFLWLVPPILIDNFPIINIHPALLPKYGGKNMFGDNVHQAVLQNKEKVSGITIHYVNEKYDDGAIIFQTTCPVEVTDTVDSLANKVHQLEYKYYPQIIEQVINSLPQVK
jgi:phosphoribosylglycinamide formyltransferase-1